MYKIHVNIKNKTIVYLFKLLLMFKFINCIRSNDWVIVPSRNIPKTLNYTLNSIDNNKNYYNNNIVYNSTKKSNNYNNDNNFQPMYNSVFYNNNTGDDKNNNLNKNKFIIFRNSIEQIKSDRNDDDVNDNNYVTTNLQNQPITYYQRPSSSAPIINYQQFDPATNMQTTVEPYFLQHLQNVKISVLTIVRKVKDMCSFLWNYFTKDNNNNNDEIESGRHGQIKVKKKFKNFMLPLLIAYKLKFLTLVPLVMGGLILLMGSTGMAGFFFAMFTAILSLKQEKH